MNFFTSCKARSGKKHLLCRPQLMTGIACSKKLLILVISISIGIKVQAFTLLNTPRALTNFSATSFNQQMTVTGTVKDDKGEVLPGVSVRVKGTNTVVTTDRNGNYSVQVPANGILSFSYIGFQLTEKTVGTQTILDVTLLADSNALDAVVVTALGIKRETKSLTYSTQSVTTEQLTKAREPNIMNSLQGKVAGLSINSSGGGVGAPTRVVLRGNRSISGDSQPLYVVDGVPINGNPQDLSSDNIASINVLKGPNAAALYGSAAQNGAIVIETKKGRAGEVRVSLNNTYMFSSPMIPIQFQNVYGQGANGVYQPSSESAWGPKLEGQMGATWSRRPELAGTQYPLNPQPNNKRDVFTDGHNFATNLSVTAGGEKTQAAFSYTYTNSSGVLPENSLGRHNISLRINTELLPGLTLDSKIEYIKQAIDNKPDEGASNFNPVMQIYMMPSNIRTIDARNFEYLDGSGLNRQDFWNPSSTLGANPYWTLYRNPNTEAKERALAMASLTYQLAEGLRIMVRSAYDGSNSSYEQRLYNDTFVRAPNGRFTVTKGNISSWNSDFLISYDKTVNDNWAFNANIGGSTKSLRNTELSSNTGLALLVPNFFAMSNTLQALSTYDQGDNMNINSVYAFGQLSWKNGIFLDLTGRNDWSSTLPPDNRSYFYPSVGLSGVLSDLMELPELISFAKIRASWAQVGNSAPPYMLSRTATFSAGGNGGFLQINGTLPNTDLRPEKTNSTEIGLDVRFFDSRIGLDLTAYKTNTSNQLFTVALPVGSGATAFFTNGGDVQNKGIEALMTTAPVQSSAFKWNLDVNFSLNRSLVKKISDERPRVVIGNDPYVREFTIEQGEPFGEIYSRGWLRDGQGRVIVGSDGMPTITSGRTVNVANFNPSWTGGVSNTFTFKNLTLSAQIEHRQGGTLVSMTNAMLDGAGLTEKTLQGREGGLVFGQNLFGNETAVLADGSPNNIQISAEKFWSGIGGRNTPVGEAFVESATNTRLRELIIGFTLPKSWIKTKRIANVTLSAVGRNLFYIYRASDSIEPDYMVGVTPDAQGFQSFAPPSNRSFGLNLKADF